MNPMKDAWKILKEEKNDDEAKKKLVACLKKEGGACSLEDCCKACDRSKAECKKLIDSMDNVAFNVKDSYVSLLELLMLTAFGAYFAGRTIEKRSK